MADREKVWDREREKRKKEKESAIIAPAVAAQRLTDKDFEGKTPEEVEMMKIMGFGNFETTKGKKVRKPSGVAFKRLIDSYCVLLSGGWQ